MKRMRVFPIAILLAATMGAQAFAQQGSPALKLPPYKKLKLPNGLTVLLMEQHEVPLISFNLIVRSGSAADPAGKEGVASATAALLRKGTGTRTADQLSAELDFIGGQLFAGAGADSTNLSAEFMKKDIVKGLDLLNDVLRNPTFPQEEVTKLVKQRVDGIKSSKDQAQGVIGNYYNAYLFGAHPYGRPANGTETSVASIARDDVVKFYEAAYVPSNVVVAAVGDFSTAEMERMLTEKFGAWPAKSPAAAAVKDAVPVQGRKLLLVDKPDSTQTSFRIGNVGIARTNPDRVAVEVVNTIFGGRFTSWLSTELRIKNGLTYGAGSAFNQRKARGPFFINSFTPNATTERAIDMAVDLLKKLQEQGISDEELKSAKAYIKGQFPTDIETNDQLAAQIADLEFYGLDAREIDGYFARIDAVTLAETKRVIKQYFPQENLVFVLIGKASEIEPAVKKYAPAVDKKAVSQPGF